MPGNGFYEYGKELRGLDRTPPQNVELEMAVLGAIMLEPKEAFPIAAEILGRDSFYLEGHSIIFDVMTDLHAEGKPPDSVAVLDALRGRDLLVKVGNSGVVLGMLNSVPTAANVEYHARRVQEKAYLRQLIRSCTRIIEDCHRQDTPLTEVLDRAEASIIALASQGFGMTWEPRPLSAALEEYVSDLSRRVELVDSSTDGKLVQSALPGLCTHFVDIDRMVTLRPSQLIIIAGRPGEGKSSLATNIAQNIVTRDRLPVLMFTLEMSEQEIAERMLCSGTRADGTWVSSSALTYPNLTTAQWDALDGSYKRLKDVPLYLWDRGYLSPPDLFSISRRMHARYGIKLIIVDYLQLMSVSERFGGNMVARVTEISNSLKRLAQELRLPVVALSQLSRESAKAGRRPQLTDLRESGSIEQDANVVMFVYHPPPNVNLKPGELPTAEIIIAKNRGGPTGTVELLWQPSITRFMNKY